MRGVARRRALCMVLVAGLLLSGQPAALAGTSDVLVLRLDVRTPAFEIDASGVSVSGYGWHDAPGAPRLPVYGAAVELPDAGSWRLEFASPGSRILDQRVALPAVPVPQMALSGPTSWTHLGELPGEVVEVDRPDPAIYGRDAFYPESPVVAGAEQWQRGKRLLAVQVLPFQYNPVTRELRYHPELQIAIHVSPGEGATAAGSGPDAVLAASAGARPAGAELGALRIRTSQRGMHRLTYDELLGAGLPLDSDDPGVRPDPASFMVSTLGEPVAIQVTGAADGRFDPGDLVIFYAEPYAGRWMRQNVYRFSYGTEPAPAGARMASTSGAPVATAPLVTAITQTLHIERDAAYFSDYPLPTEADHFFDDALYVADDPAAAIPVITRTYGLTLDDPIVTDGAVSIRALLYGGEVQVVDPDQSVALWVNDHFLDVYAWDGRVGYSLAATAPAAWLTGAGDELHLVAALLQLSGIDRYWVHPDWVDVSYPARADAEDDRIHIEGIDVAGTSATIEVDGFTTPDVRVYDVLDAASPAALLGAEAVGDGPVYGIRFGDEWAAGTVPRYYLVSDAALLPPAAIEVDRPSSWKSSANAADHIAIVHRSLWDAVQPLLDKRAADGLRVAKVDVQDVYDEFGHGRVSPETIRDFLSYAYHSWNQGGAPPRYVLLVGDGHYDFKGVTGAALPNLIPPYLIHIDPFLGETAADNRFVAMDGPDDYLPDMSIGRIPARNPAELTAAVDKILAYEDPATSPDGDWQQRVTYVADSNTDPDGSFHDLSNEVRLNWLPSSSATRTVYWGSDFTDAWQMSAAIKQGLTDSILVQWFGHASKFKWGKVQVFSIYTDMLPSAQWPFTVHFSCLTGYFINLYEGLQTLAERLILEPGEGAVADLAPSGLHVGDALLVLDQGLTLSIFRDRIRPVGEAVDAAKLYFFANNSKWHDVIDTSILLGDPALKLRTPATPPTTPLLSVARSEGGAVLSWEHELDSASYEVWRDASPYFDPSVGEGEWAGEVDAGFRGAGPPLSIEDPDDSTGGGGESGERRFWVVRSRNGDGASASSNRVGEFVFPIIGLVQ